MSRPFARLVLVRVNRIAIELRRAPTAVVAFRVVTVSGVVVYRLIERVSRTTSRVAPAAIDTVDGFRGDAFGGHGSDAASVVRSLHPYYRSSSRSPERPSRGIDGDEH